MEASNSQITIRRINIILAVNERQNILIPRLARTDIHQIFVSCEWLGYFNKKIAQGVRKVETSPPLNVQINATRSMRRACLMDKTKAQIRNGQ